MRKTKISNAPTMRTDASGIDETILTQVDVLFGPRESPGKDTAKQWYKHKKWHKESTGDRSGSSGTKSHDKSWSSDLAVAFVAWASDSNVVTLIE